VPLTDPELDLLMEMLADDPGDDAVTQVAAELVRRSRFGEAHRALRAAMAAGRDDREVRSLLARTSLETGAWADAVAHVEALGGPGTDPRLVQVWVLGLERTGQADRALSAARSWLQRVPDDVVVREAVARLQAPPLDPELRGPDPFVTAGRAERYAATDRRDRAVRVVRRLLHHHPGHGPLAARLGVLESAPHDWDADDLSEDLTDPALVPPELPMATPTLPERHTPVAHTVTPPTRWSKPSPDDPQTDPLGGHRPGRP
jgi:hypothetical protein